VGSKSKGEQVNPQSIDRLNLERERESQPDEISEWSRVEWSRLVVSGLECKRRKENGP
jgi:hypothetical protein